METSVESGGRENPEQNDENADHQILLMLVHNAHADEGDWKAQQGGHDDYLLQYRHPQPSGFILLPQTWKEKVGYRYKYVGVGGLQCLVLPG